MLGNAVNRCQATPIEMFWAITMNQAIETTILIVATVQSRFSSAPVDSPETSGANSEEIGYVALQPAPPSPSSAALIARSARTAMAMTRTVAST